MCAEIDTNVIFYKLTAISVPPSHRPKDVCEIRQNTSDRRKRQATMTVLPEHKHSAASLGSTHHL